MSAEMMDNQVAYEQLDQLEDEFEEVELELLRHQHKLSQALYAKRAQTVSQIPNFWPLVFEQAPPDIDEFIQPTDSNVLGHLVKLEVDRFELPHGDPRSLCIRFGFRENEWFEDAELEKRFWWRQNKAGWEGLVSEPVRIRWKKGKDLTGGMLDLVRQVWEEEQQQQAGQAGQQTETEAKKALRHKVESTGVDGLSFFAWFGFRGLKITKEENEEAVRVEQEKRRARAEGKVDDEMEEDEEEEDDEEDAEHEDEIFPPADDLAVCIAEDLWPGAIKYFIAAQEQDAMSDVSFESDEEMEDDEQPAKKLKA